MQTREDFVTPVATPDVESDTFENDVLRDASSELNTASDEFILGHLEAAARLLDALTLRLKPKLRFPAMAALYAASRVLQARIHELQQHTSEAREALETALSTFTPIIGNAESLPERAIGDYGIALEMLGRHQDALPWLQSACDRKLDPKSVYYYLGLAQQALDQPDAAQTLEEAERQNPGNRAAVVALGECLAKLGQNEPAAEAFWRASVDAVRHENYDDALQLVNRAASLRSENPKDVGLRGAIFWKTGNLADALKLMDRTIELAPPDTNIMGQNVLAAAWRIKGRIFLQARRWDEAAAAFENSITHDPDNPISLAGLAKALMFLGRSANALPLLDLALAHDPNNLTIMADKAVALSNTGHSDEALTFLDDNAFAIDPNSLPALQAYAAVLRHKDSFAEAAKYLRRVTELSPKSIEPWLQLAECLRRDNRPKDSIKALEQVRALDLQPNSSDAARMACIHGQALSDLGNQAEAERSYRVSFGLEPNLPAFFGLIDLYRWQEVYEPAFELIDRCLAEKTIPELEALCCKALLLCDIGEFKHASELLQDLPSPDARTYTIRGWALENQGRAFIKRAIVEYQKAFVTDPGDVWRKVRLANALRISGRESASKKIYQDIATILMSRCDSLKAYDIWLLGWCDLHLEKHDDAIRYLGAAVSADVGFPHFDLALAYLCDGRPGLAESSYRNAIALLKKKNRLRQKGLLLIAIQYLEVTARLRRKVTQDMVRNILGLLRAALSEASEANTAAQA